MKIRTGFVSNSSSSSFCLVMTKEGYKEALSKCDAFVKHVVKNISVKHTKIDGKEIVLASTFSDAGGGGTFYAIEENDPYEGEVPEKYKDDDWIDYREAWAEFQHNLPKGSYTGQGTNF